MGVNYEVWRNVNQFTLHEAACLFSEIEPPDHDNYGVQRIELGIAISLIPFDLKTVGLNKDISPIAAYSKLLTYSIDWTQEERRKLMDEFKALEPVYLRDELTRYAKIRNVRPKFLFMDENQPNNQPPVEYDPANESVDTGKCRHSHNRGKIIGAAQVMMALCRDKCLDKDGNLTGESLWKALEDHSLLIWQTEDPPILRDAAIRHVRKVANKNE